MESPTWVDSSLSTRVGQTKMEVIDSDNTLAYYNMVIIMIAQDEEKRFKILRELG